MEDNVNVFEGLSEENKSYVSNKGFKSVEDVITSYRNLEKLQGVPQDKIIKMPDENNAQEMDAFYKKLGRPEKAEDYKFDILQGQDDKLAKAIAPELFKVGLTQKQANAIYKALETANINDHKRMQELATKEEEDLKNEWGNDYNKNLLLAQKAARIAGVSAEEIDSLQKATSYKTVMNMFKNLAGKFGEDTLKGADVNMAPKYNLTPQEAREKIEQLKNDKTWLEKMANKDKVTLQEYNELVKISVADR